MIISFLCAPGGRVVEHLWGTKEQVLEKILSIFSEITQGQNIDF